MFERSGVLSDGATVVGELQESGVQIARLEEGWRGCMGGGGGVRGSNL